MTDKETVEPIEEASTEEVIVPTGAPKVLGRFYISYQIGLIRYEQPT